MKKLLFLIIFVFMGSCQYAYSQIPDPTPEQTVTIKQSTAEACADCFTERKALKDEIAVKTKAIEDLKAQIVKLQIDYATKSAEKIAAETDVIKCESREVTYLKLIRPKQVGLINFKVGN